MAYTKIKPIHTDLARAVAYSLNPLKTTLQIEGPPGFIPLTAAYNCRIDNAAADMEATKNRWNNAGGILCYRIIQSFKPGEVTPEQAHEIGREFVRRYLSEGYEVVMGTHLDQGHLHNDICFNSVSFADGQKYRDNFADYFHGIRKVSDELCREYSLSIIDGKGQGREYRDYMDEKSGKPNRDGMIKADIDEAIRQSFTFASFLSCLRGMGYTVKQGPHITHMTVKPPGADRARRLDSLRDPRYTEEAIKARLSRQRDGIPEAPAPLPEPRPPRRYHHGGPLPRPRKKLKGFAALYFHYLYFLGIIKRKKAPGPTPQAVRADVAKLHRYSQQFLFLHRNGIETAAQLDAFENRAALQAQAVTGERRGLYTERKNTADAEKRAALTVEIDGITGELRELRRDISMCKRIRDTAPALQNKVDTMRELNAQQEPSRAPARPGTKARDILKKEDLPL